jgi:hypothetical protein
MGYQAKQIWLMNPANSTRQILEAINSFYNYWLPLHSDTDPLVLCHYTTLSGLKGILQTRSLWCTDSSCLNDPFELQYGQKLIIDKLNELIKTEKNDEILKLLNNLVNFITLINADLYHIFIACFCKEDNLLSQWRGYAAKGGGYNLSFRFNSDTKFSHNLEDPTSSDESHIILRKIIYDPNEQNKIISKYLSDIISGARKAHEHFLNHGGVPNTWSSQAALEAVNILYDINISLKNPVFAEEQEWRLIKIINPSRRQELLKFRTIEERLIPYLDTAIYESIDKNLIFPICKIRFGPLLDEINTKAVLALFLNNMGTIKCNIKINPTDIKIESAGYVLRP